MSPIAFAVGVIVSALIAVVGVKKMNWVEGFRRQLEEPFFNYILGHLVTIAAIWLWCKIIGSDKK